MEKPIKREYLVSFAAAIFLISAAFAAAGVYPFGSYTACCSDMRMQFLDLTAALFDKLKHGENIFVTYSGGFGTNLYAFAVYLLFCPFNILFLFFDKMYYQEIYLVITILKFGLAAAFASVYIKHSRLTGLSGITNIALSLIYAFCEYNIHCVINIMWLDNTALLPLVLLGIEQAVDRRKIKLLFFTYFLCVLSNYYLAFITGLFAAFYFIYYVLITDAYKVGAEKITKSLFLCAAAALCALCANAFILIPAYANISSSYSDAFAFDITNKIIKYSFYDIAALLTTYTHTTSVSGLNGFFGVAPVFLSMLYFSDTALSKKERIISAIFTIFMILGLVIRPLYLMWHIFREPTGFYGRFIYTLTFLFIVLSARFLKNVGKISAKRLVLIFLAAISLCISAFRDDPNADTIRETAVYLICAAAYLGIFLRSAHKTRFFFVILCAEACMLSFCGILTLKKYNNFGERNDYPNYIKNIGTLTANIKDDGFYRITDVTSNDLNAALASGNNAIETFSSQTNQKCLERASQLGIWCPYDYRVVNNYFNGIVSDSIFNIKYIIVSDPTKNITDDIGRNYYLNNGAASSQRLASDNYTLIYSGSDGIIYRNERAFPLMFAVNEEAVTSDKRFYDKLSNISGAYKNQAVLLNDMFGTDLKLYDEYTAEQLTPENADVSSNGGDWDDIDIVPKNNGPGYIGYILSAPKDGEYCIDARINQPASFLYAVNTIPLECAFSNNSQMLNTDIGPYRKGDDISVTIQANSQLKMKQPLLLHLRDEDFSLFSEYAAKNAVSDITLGKNGVISGNTKFTKDRLIFCSLSYDKGFHVFIDGKETEKIKIADAFMGFHLPAGQHDITVKYISPGFYTGIAISIISALISAILLIFNRKEDDI